MLEFLIGDVKSVAHENRIFHSFSLITFMICIVMIFLNLAIESMGSLFISVIIILTHPIAYYLSRFRNKLKLAVIIAGLESNIFLAINYFSNAGVGGPTLILFVATLLLMNSLLKNKDLILWISFNILTVLTIVGVEYFYPEAVIYQYPTRIDQFLDISITYVLVVILISYCIYHIRKNNDVQKSELQEKALTLKKMNAEKDKIFSIISHDLRSPLASLQQYLELIYTEDLAINERKTLESSLLKKTIDTQELLTNLLHWSKNQLDGIKLKLVEIKLLKSLNNVLEIFKTHCNQKNISYKIEVDKDIMVFADKDLLQLVIRNLLNNAVKFTPNGGFISLTADTDEQNCTVVVKDNGIGISDNKKNDIFTLKAESTFGTNHENGTGLGLMLCKEYIEIQKGKIWFDSNQLGTTFYVSLPREMIIGSNVNSKKPLSEALF
jgi:two-component system sensor histidine kinase/response regulator